MTPEEMEHILKVAEQMDKEAREKELLDYEEEIFGKKTVH